jgi:GNAT superfamily N-acetyltransferase
LNTQEILALFDQEQRRDVIYAGLRREETPTVVRHITDQVDRGESMVIHSRLNSANVDEGIRAEIDYFEGLGHNFEWKVYDHDSPPDLKARLLAHGFEAGDPEALLALDLAAAPARLLQPVTHDVRRLTRPDQLDDVVVVKRVVWPEADYLPWLQQRLADDLQLDPDHLSIYVAYMEDKPASCGWITFHEGSQFAGLWGGSTLPEYRRQGLYTALVATRLQEARQRGVRFLTIDASPMSRAVLEKYGFWLLTYTYPYKWRVKPAQP